MAVDWEAFFAPPIGSSGLTSGNHTALDEWPPATDEAFVQHSSGAGSTITFTFDMSSSPGDKKGFHVWYRCRSNDAAGYTIDEIRLTDGTSTLWTDAAPGVTIPTTEAMRVISIPDSAFSGDPSIAGLVLELDVTNLRAGNNRLFFEVLRMMKSPFTAAQEVDLPSDLSGADYSAWLAEGLGVLGAEEDEAVVVIPDMSGKGRHLVRIAGTDCVYKTADGGYLLFPGAGTRFIGCWGDDRVTGNHIWHVALRPEDTGITQAVFSHALEFAGAGVPGDKNILGIDNIGSGPQWVLMSGGGSGPEHKTAGTVTFGSDQRVTEWIQDAGDELMWEDDDASPIVEEDSGSNDLFSISFGNRESDDRPYEGRAYGLWAIAAAGFVEAEIDGARDEWVNGPSGEEASGGSTASVVITAEGAGSAARASGSDAVVTVAAEGAGTTGRSGASTAAVAVAAEGAGSKHAESGSEGQITVDAEGGGTASSAASGGSTAVVTAAGEGAGTKHAASGSEATITVDAQGDGSGGEVAAGGSTAVVTVDAEGAGTTARSGGSTGPITVSSQGAGTKHAESGSEGQITVDAEGAGTSLETASGGSTAGISVTPEGAGTGDRTGGSTAEVTVAAGGAGWKAAFGSAQAQIVVTSQGSGSLLRPWTQVDIAGELDELTLSGTTKTTLRGATVSPTLKGKL